MHLHLNDLIIYSRVDVLLILIFNANFILLLHVIGNWVILLYDYIDQIIFNIKNNIICFY